MSLWNDTTFRNLFFNSIPLIDVRAPIEYAEGSLPFSVNLPIMNDEERKLVGTCYKENGQAAAIELGHSLVSGMVKAERIESWKNFIGANPAAQLFCFRGGLRSQISCQWLNNSGVERVPIPGGYKAMRRFFLSHLEEAPLPHLIRIGGLTGSGKTITLNKTRVSIDLENLASHRGSAFGANGPQPSQIRFENELSLEIMKKSDFAVVEDESSTIGNLTIPRRFFSHMRCAPLIILNTSIEERINNIYNDYVKNSSALKFKRSLVRIAKSLGGLRYLEIEREMLNAFEKDNTLQNHENWIAKLLDYYYDPLYLRDIKRQNDLVIFQGPESEVLNYIESYGKGPSFKPGPV